MSRNVHWHLRKIRAALGPKQAAHFIWGVVRSPAPLSRWQDFTADSLPANTPDRTSICLTYKVYRPYLRPWITPRETVEYMVSHYKIMKASLFAPILADVLAEKKLVVAQMQGKNGGLYEILCSIVTTKEGEICFSFKDDQTGAILASVKGTVVSDEQKISFIIGGLQGAKPPFGRNEIVRATRDLNGLRPKQAVMHALAGFVQALGGNLLLAPGVSNHISQRGWRRFFAKKRRITADYDDFWQEIGATRQSNGDYAIPLPFHRRDISEVASKRRKEWRSRYQRVDGITQSLTQAMSASCSGE